MRKIKFVLPLLLVLIFAMGCATTPWKRTAVTGYENFANSMEVVQKNAKVFYDSGSITKEQYDKVGVIYKPAKEAAEKAKKTLDLAIDAVDALERETYMEEYTELLARFKTLFYELLDLALDFGVLSKPEYAIYKTM